MKKTLVLLLALLMAFACVVAHADSILDADPEEIMTFDTNSHVTEWNGTWVLAAAYIGEDFADEYDIDVTGFLPVPENAITLDVEALLDASNTGSPDGVLVDTKNYFHAHVYDMEGKLTFDESISDEEGAQLYVAWDCWHTEVRGEQDGDFNRGVAKFSQVKVAKDKEGSKTLYFGKITGVDSEDINDERVKFIGMNTSGNLIVFFSEDNMVEKPEKGSVGFGYVFVRAE